VICLSALGKDIEEARDKVYTEIGKVNFKDMHFRADIALREIKKQIPNIK